jgi:SAM-dependent methyltransferase
LSSREKARPGAGTLQPLARLPIDVDPAAIDSAMRPFLVSEGDAFGWRKALCRRWLSTILRMATGQEESRDRSVVESEYRDAWSKGYSRYRLDRTNLKPKPWSWRGRLLLLDPAAAARVRTVLFASVLERLKPSRVLEVGSGNGINLLSLASAFPQIEFTGVELTGEGVEQARRAQSDAAIGDIIQRYSPIRSRDCSAIGRMNFVQGDASEMDFEDGSFDLVMTVLAIEQMEHIRAEALGEIARVARRHVLMLEPFREMNSTGFKRLYVQSRGYFRGSIRELEGLGLEEVWATADYPQEAFLGTALVLTKKAANAAHRRRRGSPPAGSAR